MRDNRRDAKLQRYKSASTAAKKAIPSQVGMTIAQRKVAAEVAAAKVVIVPMIIPVDGILTNEQQQKRLEYANKGAISSALVAEMEFQAENRRNFEGRKFWSGIKSTKGLRYNKHTVY